MARTYAHLHITKFKAGVAACISHKTGSQPTRYTAALILTDVNFVVRPAGLRKFRMTGVKNVHAYVVGSRAGYVIDRPMREAKYNPLRNDSFVDSVSGQPVYRASVAVMHGSKVFYLDA